MDKAGWLKDRRLVREYIAFGGMAWLVWGLKVRFLGHHPSGFPLCSDCLRIRFTLWHVDLVCLLLQTSANHAMAFKLLS